jgi:Thermostable hemolysin
VQILVISESHARRSEVERFIADVYRDHYSASVPSFPPHLIAMLDGSGECLCASGLRFGETGFFSERYLDLPIERLLSRVARVPVRRESIFEVTGLASRAPHRATQFLRYVVAYGELAGFDWAFFTATNRLRELLGRLGLPPLALAPADPNRLDNAQVWGSYYSAAPVVCAINRTAAREFLSGQTRRAAYA